MTVSAKRRCDSYSMGSNAAIARCNREVYRDGKCAAHYKERAEREARYADPTFWANELGKANSREQSRK